MKKEGLYWHVHHLYLIEWCYSYEERADYIKLAKGDLEIPTRLRLFQPIKGKLPWRLTRALRKSSVIGRQYDNTDWDFRLQDKFDESKRFAKTMIKRYNKEIEALHKEECVDCPWNGHTIFPYIGESK